MKLLHVPLCPYVLAMKNPVPVLEKTLSLDACRLVSLNKKTPEFPVVPVAPQLRSCRRERTRFKSLIPESLQGDCTISSTGTVGVPSPQNGVTGEVQTGDELPLEAKNKYLNKTKQKQINRLQITKNYLQGS